MKTKVLLISLWVLLSIWWTWAYLYMSWIIPADINKVPTTISKSKNIENQKELIKAQDTEKDDEWYNVKWNFNINLNIPEANTSWNINLNWISYIVDDKWLKSKLWIEKGSLYISWNSINIDDLDIITNNENIYMIWYANWEVNWEKFDTKTISWASINEISKQILDIINWWKYIHINNADRYYKILPNVAKTSLWKTFLTALWTSNPNYYLSKNKFWENISQDLFKKWNYEMIFTWYVVSWKTYLKFKDSICDLYDTIPELSTQKDTCIDWIKWINNLTDKKIELIVEWDKETIKYEWVFNLLLTYWNWKLETWNIQIPWFGKISYNKNILDINIIPEVLKMQKEDLSITWKIDFNSWANWNLYITYKWNLWTSNFDMIFKDWKIESSNWNINIKDSNGQLIWKLIYKNWIFKLNILNRQKSYFWDTTTDTQLQTNYSGWVLWMALKSWNDIDLKSKLVMSNNPEWIIKWKMIDYNINWSLKDWKLNITINDINKIPLFSTRWIFKKDKIDLDMDIYLMFKQKLIINTINSWDNTNINWSLIATWLLINFPMNLNDTDSLSWNGLKTLFDIKFSWDFIKWWANYILPTNYETFDLYKNIMEIEQNKTKDITY